jgi:hypothetical protein
VSRRDRRKTRKNSLVRIADIRTQIWTMILPNTKHRRVDHLTTTFIDLQQYCRTVNTTRPCSTFGGEICLWLKSLVKSLFLCKARTYTYEGRSLSVWEPQWSEDHRLLNNTSRLDDNYHVVSVRLCLWAADTSGPAGHPLRNIWAWRTTVEWCRQAKTPPERSGKERGPRWMKWWILYKKYSFHNRRVILHALKCYEMGPPALLPL